eukprot:2846403-Pyramimonas_sp.AAC.1
MVHEAGLRLQVETGAAHDNDWRAFTLAKRGRQVTPIASSRCGPHRRIAIVARGRIAEPQQILCSMTEAT